MIEGDCFGRVDAQMESNSIMQAAVFLDRDGTINEDLHFLHEPAKVTLCSGAGEGLQMLQEAGFQLIVITNQSGVGRGYFPIEDVHAVNARLSELLQPWGVVIQAYYIAPEKPDEPSVGRKPSPAFVFQARDQFQLDLSRSFFIGDKLADLETGWNAGLRESILVRTGKGARVEQNHPELKERATICDNLGDAARHILWLLPLK